VTTTEKAQRVAATAPSADGSSSSAAASAYSIGNQLLTTAWNIAFAAAVVAAAFGRAGGRRLVAQSSAGARELNAERGEGSPAQDHAPDVAGEPGGIDP